MSLSIDNIRPPVINVELKEQLGEYLRFRHLFRNIYGFELKWEKCKALGVMMIEILETFTKEIRKFLEFIDSIKDI